MSLELKVKAKSLADEARTIRKEERKLIAAGKGATWERANLYEHRVGVVRREARATHLARAYLSGLRYRQVERTTRTPILSETALIQKTTRMLEKYGQTAGTPELVAWFSEPEAGQAAA